MFKPDTSQSYGTISRFLHWSMALAFLLMLGTVVAWRIDEEYFSLMGYHKSFGFILMVLIVIRFVWALINFNKRPHGNMMVKLGHLALYILMIAVPAIGLLRQYGAAKGGIEVFGVEIMAASAEKIPSFIKLGGDWHGELAWALFALAAGHIIMAIVHQIKGEKIINRMAGKSNH